MRPGPRKLKQTLPVLLGFGVGGRKDRLFSVLPELICYRHGHPPVPRRPNAHMRSLGVAVCSKLLTLVTRLKPSTEKWAADKFKKGHQASTRQKSRRVQRNPTLI
jgi:hypothetical protein